MSGFQVGDYVIADRAEFDVFSETFKIVGFKANMLGRTLVQVEPINGTGLRGTVFYPHELSWEDGTRPE